MTGKRLIVVLALAVAVAGGVVLVVARPGSTSAVAIARRHADLLVNLSASNVTTTLRELDKVATGPWADQLKANPAAIVNALKTSEARTRGRVDSVAVSEETKKRTTVMVAASALVTNAAGSRKVTRAYYFVMALDRVGDSWRVSRVSSGGSLDQRARRPLLRAAESDVERLLSYDAASLGRDRAEVTEVCTKRFATTYGALLSGQAGKAILAQKAASTAAVTDAGAVDDDGDRPEVLLFVRQRTTSTRLSAPRLDFAAVRVRLRKVDGRWRIDSLTKVGPIRATGAKR